VPDIRLGRDTAHQPSSPEQKQSDNAPPHELTSIQKNIKKIKNKNKNKK